MRRRSTGEKEDTEQELVKNLKERMDGKKRKGRREEKKLDSLYRD